MKKTFLLLFVLTLSIISFGQKLPFQGKLIESGSPVNGTRTLTFAIDTSWIETHTDVSVTDGLYFVVLGSTNPLPGNLFYQTDERQMGINVNGTELGPVTLYKPLAGGQDGLNLKGPGNGMITGGFYTGTPEAENLPYLGFSGNTENYLNLFLRVRRDNTTGVEAGNFFLNSTDFQSSAHYPDQLWFRNGPSLYTLQLFSQNWGNKGFGGTALLRGPNSNNIEIGNKHWVNADLPWFKMSGSQNQDVVNISVSDDSTETAYMNLFSNDNKEASFYTTGIRFNTTGENGREMASINVQNNDNTGDAAYFSLRGPTSDNINFGGKYWEGNPDLPFLHMFARASEGNEFRAVDMSATNDFGYFDVWGSDGHNSGMNSRELYLRNSEFTPFVFLRTDDDGQGNDWGRIEVNSFEKKMAAIEPKSIALRDVDNTWHNLIEMFIHNNNENGWTGELSVRGPNSNNVDIGGRYWEGNSDLPFLHLKGENNYVAVDMGMSKNNDGQQFGFINLMSENGKNLWLSPEGLGVDGVYMSTVNHPKGRSGSLTIDGPAWANFQFMPSWWEHTDLGRMLILGSGVTEAAAIDLGVWPENGEEVGNIGISSTDGSSANWGPKRFSMNGTGERILSIIENDDRGIEVGRSYTYSADEKLSRTEPTNITLFDAEGGNWKSLASMAYIDDAIGERGILTLSNKDNDNEWTTYANNGTWGSIPFNMFSGATVSGVLTINGDIEGSGTNNYNSDRRLKIDIQPLGSNMLGKINKLGGYSYFWRKDEFPQKNLSDKQQIGLIAQELEEQFPALVKTGNDGFKSVNYNGFTAVLLEAVKELNAKVDKLESENIHLQAELSASAGKPEEMAELKKQVDFLTKLVQENITSSSAESEKTADKN